MEERLTKVAKLPKSISSSSMSTIRNLARKKWQFWLCKCIISQFIICINMCSEFTHEIECCTSHSINHHCLRNIVIIVYVWCWFVTQLIFSGLCGFYLQKILPASSPNPHMCILNIFLCLLIEHNLLNTFVFITSLRLSAADRAFSAAKQNAYWNEHNQDHTFTSSSKFTFKEKEVVHISTSPTSCPSNIFLQKPIMLTLSSLKASTPVFTRKSL